MLSKLAFPLLACLLLTPCAQGTASVAALDCAAKISAALDKGAEALRRDTPFDVTATVVFPPVLPYDNIIIKDGTGTTCIKERTQGLNCQLRIGDTIHAKGKTDVERNTAIAKCLELKVLAHVDPPPPETIDAGEFFSGRRDRQVVRIVGTVNDVFRDEIDRDWTFLLLNCGSDTIYAASPSPDINSGDLKPLIGAKVSITGYCSSADNGLRRQIGHVLLVNGRDSIDILQRPAADPFDAPEIGDKRFLRPRDIPMQTRHRASGRVLAAWGKGSFLVQRANGMVMRVELAGGPLPQYGTTVEVVGFPETDLYRINLTRAAWRPRTPTGAPAADAAVDVSSRDIIADGPDRAVVKSELHGRTIRISGGVRSLPAAGGNGRFYIEDDSFLVPVDISAHPEAANGIEAGCRIEVTGTCVMELEDWRPNSVFPQIKGFMVVVRRPGDIRILSRPPWWTPGRLLAVIGALLGLLAGISVWNRTLSRRAERRGKELADEKIAHVSSDLKVYERTRLAVELHDSLAQNLTGVSLEIDTAGKLAGQDAAAMREHLDCAARTLKSCRDELRNCLWDLRHHALEESSMDEAIRQTLAPHVAGVDVAIRFDVPRERLSDNTAHAILRIVRELAANAVRHGGATAIRIAGAIENDRLLFSVSDNGCGFDPDTAPGFAEGHYGLVGIRERIERFDGDFRIESAPGRRTRATIILKLPYTT